MEEPTSADFPDNAFPNSMTDNPLQPQPPDAPEPIRNPPVIIDRNPEQPRPIQGPAEKNNNSAAHVLNPSGF